MSTTPSKSRPCPHHPKVQAQSLDLQRASAALEAVESINEHAKEYRRYVRALPATILQNGLGQALASLLSASKGKKNDAHYVLYKHLQSWLCRELEDAPYRGKPDLIKAITQGSESDYLHAHAEALAYLVWLKKFAVAFLEQEQGAS